MIKLYSGPLSLFTAKVRIALAEKDIAYERIEVGFSRSDGYEPKHPEVLAHNPKAQVPVLVDDDLVLYDSTVIIEYLEDLCPDPPLFPKDPVERARCRMLELHADEVVFPHVLALIREVFYKAESDRDAQVVDTAREAIAAIQTELDAKLADRTWFCGSFGAADIAYGLVLLFASSLGAPPPAGLDRLNAWFARCAARPAIAREIEEVTRFAAELPA